MDVLALLHHHKISAVCLFHFHEDFSKSIESLYYVSESEIYPLFLLIMVEHRNYVLDRVVSVRSKHVINCHLWSVSRSKAKNDSAEYKKSSKNYSNHSKNTRLLLVIITCPANGSRVKVIRPVSMKQTFSTHQLKRLVVTACPANGSRVKAVRAVKFSNQTVYSLP